MNPAMAAPPMMRPFSAVERSGLTSLAEGQAVEFELAPGRNGKMAAQNLKLAD